MLKKIKQHDTKENILYNKILSLSRSELFYTKFGLADTFINRIHLIFLHISFIFTRINQTKTNKEYKIFNQKMFDLIFKKIDIQILVFRPDSFKRLLMFQKLRSDSLSNILGSFKN